MSNLYEAAGFVNRPANPDATFEQALQHYEAGRFDEAEAASRQVTEQAPTHAGAWHMLGVLAAARNDHAESLACLERALSYDQSHPVVHLNHANTLLALGRYADAATAYRRAIELNPGELRALNNLAVVLTEMDQPDSIEEAESLLRRLVTLEPNSAEAHANLARFLRGRQADRRAEAADIFRQALDLDAGASAVRNDLARLYLDMDRLDEASAEVDAGLEANPDETDFYLTAAAIESRRQNFPAAIDRLDTLRARLNDAGSERGFHLGMGRIKDALDEPAAAFEHFAEANAVSRRQWQPGDAEMNALPERISQLESACSPAWADASPDDVEAAGRPPVFLIGMPESGTAWISALLKAHAGFDVLESRPTTVALLNALDQLPGNADKPLAALENLSPADRAALEAAYFGAADQYLRRRENAILLDDNPFNILNAGILHRVMPGAKFILAVRHPCDVCLSCFMQNYSRSTSAVQFLDIGDAARLYARTMNLWRHYEKLLPLQTHIVRYEHLLTNTEDELRRLLAFVDAPWDDGLAALLANGAGPETVRRLIHRRQPASVDPALETSWLKYREQLAPVLETLEPYIEYPGYPAPAEETR